LTRKKKEDIATTKTTLEEERRTSANERTNERTNERERESYSCVCVIEKLLKSTSRINFFHRTFSSSTREKKKNARTLFSPETDEKRAITMQRDAENNNNDGLCARTRREAPLSLDRSA